jgi:hypothetical protein
MSKGIQNLRRLLRDPLAQSRKEIQKIFAFLCTFAASRRKIQNIIDPVHWESP